MKIHHFETIGSTNDRLVMMAEEGAPEWTIVLADRQTAGRGRGTRRWWSPEGNLHMSVLLKPDVIAGRLLRLPVLASLAFLSSMGEGKSSLRVKWPNDILMEGRKMAGILAESRSEGERVLWAVVGFGVNMSPVPDNIPAEIRGRSAFVSELDEDLRPGDLAERIAQNLKELSGSLEGNGWEKVRQAWMEYALLNTPYIFRDGERETRGVPVRLDDSGGLVMEIDGGEVVVYSGEIVETV